MARMIPEHGPHDTNSRGELHLYSILKLNLPDDYTVIHSLPWLCSAVKELDQNAKPTGEIDFLIIHPENGVLALEVKSGIYRVENSVFIHVKNNFTINPVSQTRKNVHGLATWIGTKPLLRLRIGYGFIFPDSDFQTIPTSPGMYDTTSDPPQPLYIDYMGMSDAARQIIQLMRYWKVALSNPPLGSVRMKELIEFLTPKIDGQPQWGNRILFDNKVWLKLTSEQSRVVRTVLNNKSSLITGWPGTGKTLIVIETARKLAMENKRVLVISFNNRLTEYIRGQLSECKLSKVSTWHALCRQAARALGRSDDREDWYKTSCVEDLKEAIEKCCLGEFDALIVDESQALSLSWCDTLVNWFKGKTKAFFCDETQVFSFERETVSLTELSKILGVEPFSLTIILRMPKAVTEILSEVVPPKFQHFSPRTFEHDEVQEVITLTPYEDLVRITRCLIGAGVSSDDIVVLAGSSLEQKYNDFLSKENIKSETIGKFRGLESPIVFIVGAGVLGTAELFSAYSRATSMCIAFYNVNRFCWNEKEGFQARLQSNPVSNRILKEELSKLRIRNIIESCTSFEPLYLQSINISWVTEWKAWLIEIDNDDTSVYLWLEYLCRTWVRPIFFLKKDTLTDLYQAEISLDDGNEYIVGSFVSLRNCEKCRVLTPHKSMYINEYDCTLCLARSNFFELYSESDFESDEMSAIYSMDKLITSASVTDDLLRRRAELPIPIAAAAAYIYAKRFPRRANVLAFPLPRNRCIYNAAFAFAQSRIATYKRNGEMPINDIADEIYERYSIFGTVLSKQDWRKEFSNAIGRLYYNGYLVKIRKGLYKVVEDDHAPIGRHLNQNVSEDDNECSKPI
ncbi:TPA: NERD domain-containing protein [Aeromonas bestiarum]|nr:NERD domain-containing protein [Aeromonas bestiarum]